MCQMQRGGSLHCDARKKKKEQETLRKKSQTLHVWNHGVAQAKFIHDLGLS